MRVSVTEAKGQLTELVKRAEAGDAGVELRIAGERQPADRLAGEVARHRHLHLARHRLLVDGLGLLAALLGGAFLALADVGARLFARPAETPVGVLVAAVGAPFFVWLARRVGR